MGMIISNKKIREDFELKTDHKVQYLYDNIKITSNLEKSFGLTSGNVTITNNNNIDFSFSDLECRIEFYNRNGQITNSDNLFFTNISAYSSMSSYASSTSEYTVSYKVIPTIKNTDGLKNKIKEKIIEETRYGCY